MKKTDRRRMGRDLLVFVLVFAAAIGLSIGLSKINDDNNPFATPVFILVVALIAWLTDGYAYGAAAAICGTFCVNYMFTYPFWQFDMSITGYPLTFAAMLLVSVLISTLTTQIKKQEQLRFEAEKEKMHANLLRAISHDIRTPLASIMGASSTLTEHDELSADDRRELLTEISKEARWLVRITENLLSVTKFTGSDVALKKTEEVLEEIVGSAIVKYRRAANAALPVHVSKPDAILLVPMDATLIEQVLINLFDNVGAHAETATQIWLTIARGKGRVELRVEDDGVGIPPQALPHIFDGYASRITDNRTDNRRNMGIGLSVCNSIIRAHGGGMSATGSAHGGAAFHFWLPCEEDENAQ